MTLFRSPRAYCLLLGSLVMLLGLSCVVALGFGPARLDSGLVGRIVLQRLFGVAAEPGAWSAGQEHIVWLIRAPRVLLGACVGAGLALVGAALQAVTRNPLADPHLLGATSGATLGAVLVVLYIGEVIGLLTLPLAAFLGACPPRRRPRSLVRRVGVLQALATGGMLVGQLPVASPVGLGSAPF
ncbi:MAG: iron chelate uptake ABC transporter family permease subunit, partial [Pseudomonas aeruginosa]|nr:iron chelate uptake ABC transporter family permease subunit [Pseudomonas aeruginosa]